MRIKKTSATRVLASTVVNANSESTENAYSCDYVNKNFGELIWTNIGFTSMATKNVAGDFSNYNSFKIGYFVDNNASYILTKTGNKGANISLTYSTNYSRQIAISDSTITIGNGYYNGATNNNAIIPAFIIGYK